MVAYDLAAWFDIPQDASGPAGDFLREEILCDLYKVQAWACEDGLVLIQGEHWRAVLETADVDGVPIVWIDAVKKEQWRRVRFWVNKHSVADLGNLLRSKPGQKVDFTTLLAHVLPVA